LSNTAVILCGGRGRRLGTLGEKSPKIMSPVNDYPIIWYTILKLHEAGVRHFILPLGYKGEQIQGYIDKTFSQLDVRIDAIYTGENSSIGKRIYMVKHLIPNQPFLLINGDCLFDFNLSDLVTLHKKNSSLATLATCEVNSQYGLILVRNEKVISFSRDSKVKAFIINDKNNEDLFGYVNAGITLLNLECLEEIDLIKTVNFEKDLFPILIDKKRVSFFPITSYWFAVETQKDLDLVNGIDNQISIGSKKLKNKLLKVQAKLDIAF